MDNDFESNTFGIWGDDTVQKQDPAWVVADRVRVIRSLGEHVASLELDARYSESDAILRVFSPES
jgi:hypothetical protein